MPNLEKYSKGDLDPGSLDCESSILPGTQSTVIPFAMSVSRQQTTRMVEDGRKNWKRKP